MSLTGGVVRENSYQVHFNEDWQGKPLVDLRDELSKMFNDLLERGAKDYEAGDQARVYIEHPALQKPIVVPPQPLEELDAEMIMEVVENALQSEENLDVSEGFEVHLGIARI